MRIVYLGTPDFAVKPLQALIENKYNVVAVVCNHDKPVGRKQIITPPPVKEVAIKNGIPVFQYEKIRVEGVEDLKQLKPDLMITCAFGQILSKEILDIPKLGVYNIHASLLPKYRGASPIHYAILYGEDTTGITIMKTDVGIDTGEMLLQRDLSIKNNETCGELFDRLSILGAESIIEALPSILSGNVKLVKQNNDQASYTKIIKKEMAKINWNNTVEEICNQIRAFNPSPIAFTMLEGNPFKVFSAKRAEIKGACGQILKSDDELVVGCADGAISLLKVQKSGGKPLEIKDFLRGCKLEVGTVFSND